MPVLKFPKKVKFEIVFCLDNVQISDMGAYTSAAQEKISRALEMFKYLMGGVHLPVAQLNEMVRDR